MIDFKEPPDLTSDQLLKIAMEDVPRKSSYCKYCKKPNLQWLTYTIKGYSKWVLVELDEGGTLHRHKCSEATNAQGKALLSSFHKAFPNTSLAAFKDLDLEAELAAALKSSVEKSLAKNHGVNVPKFLGHIDNFTYDPHVKYPPAVVIDSFTDLCADSDAEGEE